MPFSDQFGAPLPLPSGSSGARPVRGTKGFNTETTSEKGPFGSLGVASMWGEGMEDRPFQTGLFQKVVGVSWGDEKHYMFTAGGLTSVTGKTVIGISKDLEKWTVVEPPPFGARTEDGMGLLVGIHFRENGKDYYVAGGWYGYKIAHGGGRSNVSSPVVGISSNKGKTWRNLGLPVTHTPTSDDGEHPDVFGYGQVNAVGYHKKSKTIYVATEYYLGFKPVPGPLHFTYELWAGTVNGGFSKVGSTSATSDDLRGSMPVVLPYPKNTNLNDLCITTGPGPLVAHRYNQVNYVTSNTPEQVVVFKGPDGDTTASVDGNTDNGISATVGRQGEVRVTSIQGTSTGITCSNGGPTLGDVDISLPATADHALSSPAWGTVSYN